MAECHTRLVLGIHTWKTLQLVDQCSVELRSDGGKNRVGEWHCKKMCGLFLSTQIKARKIKIRK